MQVSELVYRQEVGGGGRELEGGRERKRRGSQEEMTRETERRNA